MNVDTFRQLKASTPISLNEVLSFNNNTKGYSMEMGYGLCTHFSISFKHPVVYH